MLGFSVLYKHLEADLQIQLPGSNSHNHTSKPIQNIVAWTQRYQKKAVVALMPVLPWSLVTFSNPVPAVPRGRSGEKMRLLLLLDFKDG